MNTHSTRIKAKNEKIRKRRNRKARQSRRTNRGLSRKKQYR